MVHRSMHVRTAIADVDAPLDEALRESFPASDPIAVGVERRAVAATVSSERATSTIYGGGGVSIERLLPAARARLVTIADDAPLVDVARLLRAGTDLVVVCARAGAVAGVITKTDVVARIGECRGSACTTAAATVMSADVFRCSPDDLVRDVWSRMKARGLKNVPVVDTDLRPIGVLNARDALGVLLQEAEDEESLLRDYVMGVGYR